MVYQYQPSQQLRYTATRVINMTEKKRQPATRPIPTRAWVTYIRAMARAEQAWREASARAWTDFEETGAAKGSK